MTKETETGFLQGKLLAGKDAQDDERFTSDVESPETLREGVVFLSENKEILFRSAIGRYVRLKQDHLVSENSSYVYYPYYNETVAEAQNPRVNKNDLEMFRKNVELKYTIIGNDIFIHSQLEHTSYAPNYLYFNGEVYSVSIYGGNSQDYEEDEFLGIDGQENGVLVENVRTGLTGAVNADEVSKLIENDEYNGLIKVQNPSTDNFNPVRNLVLKLRDDK